MIDGGSMKKRIVKLLMIGSIIILLFSSCGNKIENITKKQEVEREIIIDATATYASYNTYEEAFDRADIVVYGKIVEIKEATQPESKLKSTRTPIVIEAIDVIKGECENNKIVYHALGGNIDGTLYKSTAYPTEKLAIGNEIIVFLKYSERSDYYYNISPSYFFFSDEDGKAAINKTKIPVVGYREKYDAEGKIKLSDFANALKEKYELVERLKK